MRLLDLSLFLFDSLVFTEILFVVSTSIPNIFRKCSCLLLSIFTGSNQKRQKCLVLTSKFY